MTSPVSKGPEIASAYPNVTATLGTKEEKSWFDRTVTVPVIKFKAGDKVIEVAYKQKWTTPILSLFNRSLEGKDYVQVRVEDQDVYVRVNDAIKSLGFDVQGRREPGEEILRSGLAEGSPLSSSKIKANEGVSKPGRFAQYQQSWSKAIVDMVGGWLRGEKTSSSSIAKTSTKQIGKASQEEEEEEVKDLPLPDAATQAKNRLDFMIKKASQKADREFLIGELSETVMVQMPKDNLSKDSLDESLTDTESLSSEEECEKALTLGSVNAIKKRTENILWSLNVDKNPIEDFKKGELVFRNEEGRLAVLEGVGAITAANVKSVFFRSAKHVSKEEVAEAVNIITKLAKEGRGGRFCCNGKYIKLQANKTLVGKDINEWINARNSDDYLDKFLKSQSISNRPEKILQLKEDLKKSGVADVAPGIIVRRSENGELKILRVSKNVKAKEGGIERFSQGNVAKVPGSGVKQFEANLNTQGLADLCPGVVVYKNSEGQEEVLEVAKGVKATAIKDLFFGETHEISTEKMGDVRIVLDKVATGSDRVFLPNGTRVYLDDDKGLKGENLKDYGLRRDESAIKEFLIKFYSKDATSPSDQVGNQCQAFVQSLKECGMAQLTAGLIVCSAPDRKLEIVECAQGLDVFNVRNILTAAAGGQFKVDSKCVGNVLKKLKKPCDSVSISPEKHVYLDANGTLKTIRVLDKTLQDEVSTFFQSDESKAEKERILNSLERPFQCLFSKGKCFYLDSHLQLCVVRDTTKSNVQDVGSNQIVLIDKASKTNSFEVLYALPGVTAAGVRRVFFDDKEEVPLEKVQEAMCILKDFNKINGRQSAFCSDGKEVSLKQDKLGAIPIKEWINYPDKGMRNQFLQRFCLQNVGGDKKKIESLVEAFNRDLEAQGMAALISGMLVLKNAKGELEVLQVAKGITAKAILKELPNESLDTRKMILEKLKSPGDVVFLPDGRCAYLNKDKNLKVDGIKTWINSPDNKNILNAFLDSSPVEAIFNQVLESVKENLKEINGLYFKLFSGAATELKVKSLESMQEKLGKIGKVKEALKSMLLKESSELNFPMENAIKLVTLPGFYFFTSDGSYLSLDKQKDLITIPVEQWITVDPAEIDLFLRLFFSNVTEVEGEIDLRLNALKNNLDNFGLAELCPGVLVFENKEGTLEVARVLKEITEADIQEVFFDNLIEPVTGASSEKVGEVVKALQGLRKPGDVSQILSDGRSVYLDEEGTLKKTVKVKKKVTFKDSGESAPVLSSNVDNIPDGKFKYVDTRAARLVRLEQEKAALDEVLEKAVSTEKEALEYGEGIINSLLSPQKLWSNVVSGGSALIQSGSDLVMGLFNAVSSSDTYAGGLVASYKEDMQKIASDLEATGSLQGLQKNVVGTIEALVASKTNATVQGIVEDPKNAKPLEDLTVDVMPVLRTVLGLCVIARLCMWISEMELSKSEPTQTNELKSSLRAEVEANITRLNEEKVSLEKAGPDLERTMNEMQENIEKFKTDLSGEKATGLNPNRSKNIKKFEGNITRLTGELKKMAGQRREMTERLKAIEQEKGLFNEKLV